MLHENGALVHAEAESVGRRIDISRVKLQRALHVGAVQVSSDRQRAHSTSVKGNISTLKEGIQQREREILK